MSSETMELLMNRVPLVLRVPMNFLREGPFMTMRSSITSPRGAPMASSEMTTKQLAVPPRCSAP